MKTCIAVTDQQLIDRMVADGEFCLWSEITVKEENSAVLTLVPSTDWYVIEFTRIRGGLWLVESIQWLTEASFWRLVNSVINQPKR